MNNVMLDLETWGTRPGCAIRSIGACMFDPYGTGHGAVFYENISDASCEIAGLHVDPNTVKWWQGQTVTAQKMLLTNQIELSEAGEKFDAWWKKNRGIFVWSHGENFDEPIWSAAMYAVGRKVPWRFWDARCTRTIYDITLFDAKSVKRKGTYHNALDDSIHQVKCVQQAYAKAQKMLGVEE